MHFLKSVTLKKHLKCAQMCLKTHFFNTPNDTWYPKIHSFKNTGTHTSIDKQECWKFGLFDLFFSYYNYYYLSMVKIIPPSLPKTGQNVVLNPKLKTTFHSSYIWTQCPYFSMTPPFFQILNYALDLSLNSNFFIHNDDKQNLLNS